MITFAIRSNFWISKANGFRDAYRRCSRLQEPLESRATKFSQEKNTNAIAAIVVQEHSLMEF